ncbi:MAG: NAD(P)/FAD-dependent oxidoreductase [Rhodobacteraceae bacterium]|nr:NAD(P)/FAD-dependent oxidoreductase [Paracoccaceae bacterium]
MTWDAIVIGAGHNGLIAAARLGQAGKRVLVLEAREAPGGLMAARGGMTVAMLPTALNADVARALDLHRHGLSYGAPVATLALGAGGAVRISGREASGAGKAVAVAYGALHDRLTRQAAALGRMLMKTPPRLRDGGAGDLIALARMGLGIRLLGKDEMRDLLRILLSNIWDVLNDEIGDGPLAAALAMEATLGGAMGPRSPGTVLPLLYRMAGRGRLRALGGPDAVIAALVRAVGAGGGAIRTGAEVARILVGEDDRAGGVRLTTGEEIRAPLILSNAHPRRTLNDLLGVAHLDAEDARRARLMASTGMVARLDFALSGAPVADGGMAIPSGERLIVAGNMAALETAFNAAKYKEIPDRPVLECTYEAGRGLLSVNAQFVPCEVKGGWTDKARATLEGNVRAVLAGAMPGFQAMIAGVETLTPADIEARFGLPGGHWHHGEFRVDQMLMMRPFGGAAQYRMPVAGLYLCGAGAHPGGDITGVPGWNAAGQALKDGRAAK